MKIIMNKNGPGFRYLDDSVLTRIEDEEMWLQGAHIAWLQNLLTNAKSGITIEFMVQE